MGNRSKFAAVTAAAGALGLNALRARRHARLEHTVEGIVSAIKPSGAADAPSKPAPTADEAHAPGHQHLHRAANTEEASTASRLRGRPWNAGDRARAWSRRG